MMIVAILTFMIFCPQTCVVTIDDSWMKMTIVNSLVMIDYHKNKSQWKRDEITLIFAHTSCVVAIDGSEDFYRKTINNDWF